MSDCDPSSPTASWLGSSAPSPATTSVARDERRLGNRLRHDLIATFPAALTIGEKDLGAPTFLHMLKRWPTADALQAVRADLEAFARSHHHGRPERFAGTEAALAQERFRPKEYLVRAKADTIRLAATQLLAIGQQRRAWERRMGELLLGAPRQGRDHQPRGDGLGNGFPGGEIYLSFPGLGDRLAARIAGEIGDHPAQFDTPSSLQCYAGKAPVTRRSGKSELVVAYRLAHNRFLVLAVDRASFPSDTLSTLIIHAPGAAALRRWGLLDEVLASNCPPIDRYSFDFGPFAIAGSPRPSDGVSIGCAPRRTVLDAILVEAAARAGVEVRERFTVDEVVIEDGVVVGIRGHSPDGSTVFERARIVVGADGRNSVVAKAVRPEQYNDKPKLQVAYYTFWSGLPTDGVETVIRPDRGMAAIPTNDGLTLILVGWPVAEAGAYKSDIEGNYLRTIELAEELAERVRRATREERFTGGGVPNFLRKPYGRGWVLVGDAGYTKDPITAQGISDAFRDAELCASALDQTLTGERSFEDAMADYHRTRDAHVLPMYEFTTQLATLKPPPPEIQQLLGAVAGNPEAMDAFVSMAAGTLSVPEFFDPENIGRLMSVAPAVYVNGQSPTATNALQVRRWSALTRGRRTASAARTGPSGAARRAPRAPALSRRRAGTSSRRRGPLRGTRPPRCVQPGGPPRTSSPASSTSTVWTARTSSYDWDATRGEHVLSCRARDAAGQASRWSSPRNLQGMGNNLVQEVSVSVR